MNERKFFFYIDFLRVGERSRSGDCACLRWGENIGEEGRKPFVMVIDGGFSSNVGSLTKKVREITGVDYIDILVSTHPHSDHIGGLGKFIDDFKVRKVVIHQPWKHIGLKELMLDKNANYDLAALEKFGLKSAYELVEHATKSTGTHVDEWFAGSEFDCDGARISVLNPSLDRYDSLVWEFGRGQTVDEDGSQRVLESEDTPDNGAENNSCIVLAISFPKLTNKWVLLTSDVGASSLDMVLQCISRLGLKQNSLRLFQIPHHGSIANLTQSQLDELLGCPDDAKERESGIGYAVASVAENADENHPHEKIVKWLNERNMKVSTTRKGTYTYSLTVNLKR